MKYCHLGTVHTEAQRASDCNIGILPAACFARLMMILDRHPDSLTRERARLEIGAREDLIELQRRQTEALG